MDRGITVRKIGKSFKHFETYLMVMLQYTSKESKNSLSDIEFLQNWT